MQQEQKMLCFGRGRPSQGVGLLLLLLLHLGSRGVAGLTREEGKGYSACPGVGWYSSTSFLGDDAHDDDAAQMAPGKAH